MKDLLSKQDVKITKYIYIFVYPTDPLHEKKREENRTVKLNKMKKKNNNNNNKHKKKKLLKQQNFKTE